MLLYGKKRKDSKASTNTAPIKEVGAPHRQQHSANLKLIFEKIKNTEEKKRKKIWLSCYHST